MSMSSSRNKMTLSEIPMSGKGDASSDGMFKAANSIFKIEPHLEFLEIAEDGHTLLGSSNLTGTIWNGTLWCFNDANNAPFKSRASAVHNCESGIVDGKFLGSPEKIVIGEDSGALTIFNILEFDQNDIHFVPQMYATHHDSSITALSVSHSKRNIVSVGMDTCICIWDNETLSEDCRYYCAHSRAITSVSYCPKGESNLFATCSLDRTSILWDHRTPKPAQVLIKNPVCGYNAVAWKDDNAVVLGNLCGEIELLDVRTKSQILSVPLFERPIHKFSINDKGLVAVCADSNTVIVWDCNANEKVYSDSRHGNFVRGVSWHPKTKKLFSCGYGREVLSHNVLEASAA